MRIQTPFNTCLEHTFLVTFACVEWSYSDKGNHRRYDTNNSSIQPGIQPGMESI